MLFLLIFAFSPLAIGQSCTTDGAGAYKAGTGACAGGANSTAVGPNSTTYDDRTIAIGHDSEAGDTDTDGTGPSSIDVNLDASNAIAIGSRSRAAQANGIAIGSSSLVLGQSAIAIGTASSAAGTSSTAVGAGTQVSGANAIAIGSYVNAVHDGSTVIGYGAFGAPLVTDRDNQVKIGDTGATYTLTGVASATSTTAQGTVDGLVTVDANGNLASDGGTLQTSVTAANTTATAANTAATAANTAANTAQTTADRAETNVNILAGRVTTLESSSSVAMTERIDTLSSDLESGLASLAAMTALPNVVPAGGQFALGFGAGKHGSEQAFAIGFAATGEARRVHINLGASNAGTAGTTTRGGFSVVW